MRELTHRSTEAIKAFAHSSARITRTAMRRLRQEGGQTAAEYVGIILVVAAIVAGITATGIGGEVSKRIQNTVKTIAPGD